MYKNFIQRLLFLFPAENVHNFALSLLHFFGATMLGRWLLKISYSFHDETLEREVFGIRFPNPIGVAAGFDKNGALYRVLGSMGWGFVEIGTLTPKPQQGNVKPRMFRLPKDSAMINRMGYNNYGLDKALCNIRRRGHGNDNVILGANIAKNTLTRPEDATADYLKIFRNLYQYVDYFTVNVSTLMETIYVDKPEDVESVGAILSALFDFRRGQNQYRPILLKISPDWSFEQIDRAVGLLVDTPLDGLVVAGTTFSREKLSTSPDTVAQIGDGGLSGAPLFSRTLELIEYVNEKIEGRYPIIAVGGVMTPDDARRLLDAGASLVQVYTGITYNGLGFGKSICRHLASLARNAHNAEGGEKLV